MIYKNVLPAVATLILCMFFLTSCEKEAIDETTEEEDPITDVVDCNDLGLMLSVDGSEIYSAIEGGNEPYVYVWNNEETTASIAVEESGDYELTVVDSEGCTVTATTTVNLENPCPSISIQLFPSSMTGGIEVDVEGGTAPYAFLWSTGETDQYIEVAESGTYSLTVTDAEGCSSSSSVEVELDATDPCTDFSVEMFADPNGGIEAGVTGGTAPYFFLWSTGETSTGETSEGYIEVAESGTYSLTITDANGCTSFASTEVEIEDQVDPCTSFSVQLFADPNGGIESGVNGGTAPFVYSWSTGEVAEGYIEVDESGTYTLTVTDVNGCTTVSSVDVELGDQIEPCSSLNLQLFPDPSTGLIGAEVWGGNPPYNFEWSTGETTDFIQVSESGTYSVTIVDSEGCTISGEVVL
ncbi:hypothetical protein N8482_00625 [Chitinophagales bacterium]|nr:hypothetical protein [Chitinophagales bacterium]